MQLLSKPYHLEIWKPICTQSERDQDKPQAQPDTQTPRHIDTRHRRLAVATQFGPNPPGNLAGYSLVIRQTETEKQRQCDSRTLVSFIKDRLPATMNMNVTLLTVVTVAVGRLGVGTTCKWSIALAGMAIRRDAFM